MQSQGCGSSSGGSISFPLINLPEITRVNDVLDRQNVAWQEWLVLTSLERDTDRRRIVWQAVETSKGFGTQLTKADVLRSLGTCLQFGWICEVDKQVNSEDLSMVNVGFARMGSYEASQVDG